MLSRWYLIFIGLVLIIMGIAGYFSPRFLQEASLGSWTPTIWVITAIVALVVAFFIKSVNVLRWFAGIIGALYFIWGSIALFGRQPSTLDLRQLLSTLMLMMGSLGVAAALAPAYWLREHETYAPGRA